jgi:hypothetical protein
MKLVRATAAPIANVIAANWNAGIFPVATVMTDSSDHIRIAVSPISVAVREVMAQSTVGISVMAGFIPAIHVFSLSVVKTWMPGTSPGMTTY